VVIISHKFLFAVLYPYYIVFSAVCQAFFLFYSATF
jgi:hypothetical protein